MAVSIRCFQNHFMKKCARSPVPSIKQILFVRVPGKKNTHPVCNLKPLQPSMSAMFQMDGCKSRHETFAQHNRNQIIKHGKFTPKKGLDFFFPKNRFGCKKPRCFSHLSERMARLAIWNLQSWIPIPNQARIYATQIGHPPTVTHRHVWQHHGSASIFSHKWS